MANTKSAAKRARQTDWRSRRNRSALRRLKGMQKRADRPDAHPDLIRLLISAIDNAAKRGIIHKNAANRRKARLNKSLRVNAAETAASAK